MWGARKLRCLGAGVLVTGVVAAASSAAATAPPGPTLKLSLPNPIHVNKSYRITASGHTDRPVLLSAFIQTEANGKCRKNPNGESRHHGYPAITPYGPPRVLPGDYKKKSDKLADTKANGHDYACGYLQDPATFKVLLRVEKRVKSKP